MKLCGVKWLQILKDRNRGTLAFGLEFFNIPCQTLKSMGFDSMLKEAEGRNRKDGKVLIKACQGMKQGKKS